MKNRLLCCLIFLISLNTYCLANQIIYKESKKEMISSGTYLSDYEILTEDGWVQAHVLEADLKDENINIEILSSEEGASKLASTMAMSKYKNAIAGINADFFSGRNGKGHSIGLSISDKNLIASNSEENTNNTKSQFSTLYIYEDDNVFVDFFNGDITLYTNKASTKVNCINKYTSYPEVPAIYTRQWGEYSIGSTEELPVLEVVVEDNEVVELRENKEPCQIPENGFVIFANSDGAEFLKENLKIGSEVSYKINYTPDISKIKFAISGGAVLLENGEIPEEYSHKINGRNPRTCIGVDKRQ